MRSRHHGRWLCGIGTALVLLLTVAPKAEEGLELPVPAGVLPLEIPADNPPTAAKVELGKKLYFDTRLSTDGTVACVSCHDPGHGFADPRGKATSAGVFSLPISGASGH